MIGANKSRKRQIKPGSGQKWRAQGPGRGCGGGTGGSKDESVERGMFLQ